MFQRPFGYLAALLLGTVLCPIFLPFAILVGYPALILIGVWCVILRLQGRLERPGRMASVWAIYLGFVLILHGVLICFDSALGGAPPSDEEKRFGRGLAYVGGAVAGTSAVAAFLIDMGHGRSRKSSVKSEPIDDLVA